MNEQDKTPAKAEDTDSGTPALAIAITSGKGGVGKTNITTNLGLSLAKSGKQVCIFDADTSLANINILLNIKPEYTLHDFMTGDRTLDDIMVSGPDLTTSGSLQIVPSATGITDYLNLDKPQQDKLLGALEELEQRFDYLLIDTAAGISDNVIQFIQSAQYAVVVVSPEPTSLTDAFSLIKVLQRRDYQQPIYVLVNMVANYTESMDVFKRFAHAVNKYVQLKVRYLGYVPTDRKVRSAVASQIPVVLSAPESPSARCIALLANILEKHFTADTGPIRKISQFWRAQGEQLPAEAGAEVHEETAPATTDADATAAEPSPTEMDTGEATSTSEPEDQQGLDREQAEARLSELIRNYLAEFGTLPEQAINLALQAHAQGEISDDAIAGLQPTQEPTSMTRQPQQSSRQFFSRIDQLTEEAERTKRELTEMAELLRDRCMALYNVDISRTTPAVTKANIKALKTQKNSALTEGIASAMHYASATDER